MNKRIKAFRIIPEFLNILFRGEAFRIVKLPKDVELLRFKYDVLRDGIIIILTSKEWPEVDTGEMLDINDLKFEKV